MENKKQEAIRKAYGEHWENVKKYVNERGWCNYKALFGDMGNSIGYLEDLQMEVMDNYHPTYCYYNRPKSLSEIENNNGWTLIESLKQIQEHADCGTEHIASCHIDNKTFDFLTGKQLVSAFKKGEVTHYEKPRLRSLPIY